MNEPPHHDRNSPVRARTLEYKQAMKDFHTMFPNLEKDIIECVLRANAGHVDSTIDQLLLLTQDTMSQNNRNMRSFQRRYYTYDDSTDSSGSLSSEVRDRLSSSDEDHLPPRYTPHFEPPPSPYTFSNNPVEPVTTKSRMFDPSVQQKRYRDWNPPLLGALPHDFLRILPQQSNGSSRKVSSPHNHSHSRNQGRHQRTHNPGRQSSHSSARHAPNVHPSPHRQLQRRRTTGEVNVVLKQTPNVERSSQQRMVMVDSPLERAASSHHHLRHHSSSPTSSSRNRSGPEFNQYVEDRKFALLLQNEEFLKELRRNEQFLQELNKDVPPENSRSSTAQTRNQFKPIHIDPLSEIPAPNATHPESNRGVQDTPEDKDFRESLKYMSKSAKKSFYEIARRFTAKRKSYKSMNTIDPVFANCEDDEPR